MNCRRYTAEFLGTFVLTLAVLLSVGFALPLSAPVAAALTLGLFVYTVGPVSGSHLNPAVTLGLLSVDRMKPRDAGLYILAQLAGATIAMVLVSTITGDPVRISSASSVHVGIGELLGTFILTFGVTSVAAKQVNAAASGLVVGGSLLLGIFIASAFSDGIINPAIAWSVGALNPMTVLGPIVGGIGGAWAHRVIAE